ncbi:MAG: hypothetical protein NC299_08280 [Lachnospiraceae bacterium]|nr:hypothetical protein [Ruminococcus sp.]MCM1275350.1 hypothetical protein [Lachnospiraceae bacterium]
MCGILYGNFILNKKWFLAAGITAVFGTVSCAVLNGLMPDDVAATSMIFIGVQLITFAILSEWLARNLESNVKCRFTDLTLAGGVSKNMFVMSELLKNLITIAAGMALCIIMQLVMSVFNKEFFTLESVKMIAVLGFFCGAVEWTVNPLTISFKSAEKAGLTMGLIIGFGLVMPIMILLNTFTEETETLVNRLPELFSGNTLTLIMVGISAALYVIFYFALLARIKKGDVC